MRRIAFVCRLRGAVRRRRPGSLVLLMPVDRLHAARVWWVISSLPSTGHVRGSGEVRAERALVGGWTDAVVDPRCVVVSQEPAQAGDESVVVQRERPRTPATCSVQSAGAEAPGAVRIRLSEIGQWLVTVLRPQLKAREVQRTVFRSIMCPSAAYAAIPEAKGVGIRCWIRRVAGSSTAVWSRVTAARRLPSSRKRRPRGSNSSGGNPTGTWCRLTLPS